MALWTAEVSGAPRELYSKSMQDSPMLAGCLFLWNPGLRCRGVMVNVKPRDWQMGGQKSPTETGLTTRLASMWWIKSDFLNMCHPMIRILLSDIYSLIMDHLIAPILHVFDTGAPQDRQDPVDGTFLLTWMELLGCTPFLSKPIILVSKWFWTLNHSLIPVRGF